MLLLLLALAAPVAAEPRGRVTEENTWARLTERARQSPTSVETLTIAGTEYEVFVVTMTVEAVEAQCPAEMTPRVSFYFSRPLSGPGGGV